MEICARIDYVGIGWLISASVATVVIYGYQCHPQVGHTFMGVCISMAVLGNILPFMEWFNQYKYRVSQYIALQIV
jgi:adiponectin receptor